MTRSVMDRGVNQNTFKNNRPPVNSPLPSNTNSRTSNNLTGSYQNQISIPGQNAVSPKSDGYIPYSGGKDSLNRISNQNNNSSLNRNQQGTSQAKANQQIQGGGGIVQQTKPANQLGNFIGKVNQPTQGIVTKPITNQIGNPQASEISNPIKTNQVGIVTKPINQTGINGGFQNTAKTNQTIQSTSHQPSKPILSTNASTLHSVHNNTVRQNIIQAPQVASKNSIPTPSRLGNAQVQNNQPSYLHPKPIQHPIQQKQINANNVPQVPPYFQQAPVKNEYFNAQPPVSKHTAVGNSNFQPSDESSEKFIAEIQSAGTNQANNLDDFTFPEIDADDIEAILSQPPNEFVRASFASDTQSNNPKAVEINYPKFSHPGTTNSDSYKVNAPQNQSHSGLQFSASIPSSSHTQSTDLVSTQFTPATNELLELKNEISRLNEMVKGMRNEGNRITQESHDSRKQIELKMEECRILKNQKSEITKQLNAEITKNEKKERDWNQEIRKLREENSNLRSINSSSINQIKLETDKVMRDLKIELEAEIDAHKQTKMTLETVASKSAKVQTIEVEKMGNQLREKERNLLVKKLLSNASGLCTLLGDNVFPQFEQGPRNRLFSVLSSIICDELQQPSALLIEIEGILTQSTNTIIIENSLSTILTMVAFNTNCRECFTNLRETLLKSPITLNVSQNPFDQLPILHCKLFDWLLDRLQELEGESLCKTLEIFYSACWNNQDDLLFVKFEPLFKNNTLLALLEVPKTKLNDALVTEDSTFLRSRELTIDLLKLIVVSPTLWEQFKSPMNSSAISKLLIMNRGHPSTRMLRNKIVRFLSFIAVHHKDSISVICGEQKMVPRILLLLEYELEYFGSSIEITADDLELQLLREGVQLLVRLGEELDFSLFEDNNVATFGFNTISKLCQLGGNPHLIGIAEQSIRLREWFSQAIRMNPSFTQR
eukprot:TRINITY_DN5256_c0_g1_i1.p1 TRINITY_DN5256_c0_g1~~TRINITY_DN5256_c0_g1_i1.p1  ORF type:complete len:944 (-),score=166.61 TRINITY_DN5256_c0_g1_i1:748-3579(-)